MNEDSKMEIIECPHCGVRGDLAPIELITTSGYENFLECLTCGIILRG